VRYLTSVDQDEHVALVALDQSREILGSARYIRIPARPSVAEMAIEVIDDWQRRGVGRALLEALSLHAEDAGVVRFVAIVSMENMPMQRIMARAGASSEKVDGELEYTVDAGALAPEDRRRQPRSTRSRGAAEGLPFLLGTNPWKGGPLTAGQSATGP
jgi:RimJ/RimL family protein N-acetyltransferase